MEDKNLQVITGPIGNQQTCTVILNGVDLDERLTPKMARRAARVAHGGGWAATVWDTQAGIGYRLYRRSARKLYYD